MLGSVVSMTLYDVFKAVCKSENKWGLYFTFDFDAEDHIEQIGKNAPCILTLKEWDDNARYQYNYIFNPKLFPPPDVDKLKPTIDNFWQGFTDGFFFLLFDREEDCREWYEPIECDNPAPGTSGVYAMVISNQGVIVTENT